MAACCAEIALPASTQPATNANSLPLKKSSLRGNVPQD
jgi:hypothetical protein